MCIRDRQFIQSASESEKLAMEVSDTNGCYVVPAFTGLGAPYWDAYARGTIVGITRGVNKKHIVRATLESIAFQVEDVLEAMEQDLGMVLTRLRVDGGASANQFLMQRQADISNVPVDRPECVESTALGAAYLAGLAVGFYESMDELIANQQKMTTFIPAIGDEERSGMLTGWKKAVGRTYEWDR